MKRAIRASRLSTLWMQKACSILVFCMLVIGCECQKQDCIRQRDCPNQQICLQGICISKNPGDAGPQKKEEPYEAPRKHTEFAIENPEPTLKEKQTIEEHSQTTEQTREYTTANDVDASINTEKRTTPEEVPEALREFSVENNNPPEPKGKTCTELWGCRTSEYCIKGRCRLAPLCRSDADCKKPPLTICYNGVCTMGQAPCKVTGDCFSRSTCVKGKCIPGLPFTCKVRSDCPHFFDCVKGICKWNYTYKSILLKCNGRGTCPTGTRCYLGMCLPKCEKDQDCPPFFKCLLNMCTYKNLSPGKCRFDEECLPRQYCDVSGKCATCPKGVECKKNSDCKSGQSCVNGRCGIPCWQNYPRRCPATSVSYTCRKSICVEPKQDSTTCRQKQEAPDLTITKVKCVNGTPEVTIQNIGDGPAYGLFSLCHVSNFLKPPRVSCGSSALINFKSRGLLRPGGIEVVKLYYSPFNLKLLTNKLIVDPWNQVMEKNENNNNYLLKTKCP